ncbi:MAG: response regulator [Bacillales bacterium]|jgi:signal transduction histidine kinase|nr:response regulator [Bacillales bacterium]
MKKENIKISVAFAIRFRAALIIMLVVIFNAVLTTTIGIIQSNKEITKTISQDLTLVGSLASDSITASINKIKEDDVSYVGGMMARAYYGEDASNPNADNLQSTLDSEVGPGPSFISLAVIFDDSRIYSAEKVGYEWAKPVQEDWEDYYNKAPIGEARVDNCTKTLSGDIVIRVYLKISDEAVFVATLRGEYFSTLISSSNYEIYDAGQIFMIDSTGYVIADSTNSFLFTRFGEDTTIAKIIKEALESDETRSKVVSYRDDNNKKVLGALTPIIHGEERWLLFISVPEASTPIISLNFVFLITGAIFVILGILSAIILSYFQVKPYVELDKKNEQLIILKAEAESAGNAKGLFLSNMSHEIRTPLNAIIGMTTIAKKSSGEKTKNECLVKIEEASKHLMGVINDILDMSKIEANKFELAPTEVNVDDLLRKVSGVISFKTDEKRQKFTISIGDNIPQTIVVDEQRIAQTLVNILGNAVKFTPNEGEITLDMSLLNITDTECELQFRIKDTGIGITEEQKNKLFKHFEQADNNISRKFGGTGLGLAISKNIIEMMKGHIWCESEYGHGSTFIFNIVVPLGHSQESRFTNLKGLSFVVLESNTNVVNYLNKIGLENDFKVKEINELADVLNINDYNYFYIGIDVTNFEEVLSFIISSFANIEKLILSATRYDLVVFEDKIRELNIKILAKPFFSSDLNALLEDVNNIMEDDAYIYEDVFKGKTILLAEDIEINREIVTTLLQPTGVEVVSAENGRIAVDLFNKNPELFDAILMDIQMPEMDGYTATKIIRGLDNEKAKTIPIIAMTANVFKEDIEKCLEAGMNDHLGKPLDISQVIKKIKDLLNIV